MNEVISAVGIVSMGRQLFGETHKSVNRATAAFGFPFLESDSPYWDQSLVRATKDALKQRPEAKYVCYFDGDSVVDRKDLLDLYQIIEKGTVNGKKIDAVCPIQADRFGNKPLVYNWCAPQNNYDYAAPFCPAIHGHFGCTFIRREVFESGKFPEPWAVGQPAPDGTWDQKPGKMDPDTYFWVKLHQSGHTLVQLNHTVVGHIQVGIRWQQGDKVVWQHWREYEANGKPYGCRVPLPLEYRGEALPHSTNGTPETTDGQEWLHYRNRPVAHLSAKADPEALANFATPPKPNVAGAPMSESGGFAPPEYATPGTCIMFDPTKQTPGEAIKEWAKGAA